MFFHAEIDVQIGNGRLNYINEYVAKDHDAVDVGMGEYTQKNSTATHTGGVKFYAMVLQTHTSPSFKSMVWRSKMLEYEPGWAAVRMVMMIIMTKMKMQMLSEIDTILYWFLQSIWKVDENAKLAW